jgi:hypothetical protein
MQEGNRYLVGKECTMSGSKTQTAGLPEQSSPPSGQHIEPAPVIVKGSAQLTEAAPILEFHFNTFVEWDSEADRKAYAKL